MIEEIIFLWTLQRRVNRHNDHDDWTALGRQFAYIGNGDLALWCWRQP